MMSSIMPLNLNSISCVKIYEIQALAKITIGYSGAQ